MDIEKLIEQYRQAADKWEKRHPITGTFDLRVQDALRDAATALSTLQEENEKLRAELDDLRIQWDMYGGDVGITAVYKELEQAKRCIEIIEKQRDSAIEELENYMVQDVIDGNEPCGICAKASDTPCECCVPKWRGPKKED